MRTVLRMENLQDNNTNAYEEDLCHVRFKLCDARRDGVITCIAKGAIARDFVRVYEQNDAKSIVCVLRFLIVSDGKGVDSKDVILQSHYPCSQFFNPINDDVREFQEI